MIFFFIVVTFVKNLYCSDFVKNLYCGDFVKNLYCGDFVKNCPKLKRWSK